MSENQKLSKNGGGRAGGGGGGKDFIYTLFNTQSVLLCPHCDTAERGYLHAKWSKTENIY